jgi:hypothetical protein
MGINQGPDVGQELIKKAFKEIQDKVEVYFDDVAVFSNSWEHHMKTLENVLTILKDKGFSINPLKCEWAVQKTNFLGHWLTPQGIKP